MTIPRDRIRDKVSALAAKYAMQTPGFADWDHERFLDLLGQQAEIVRLRRRTGQSSEAQAAALEGLIDNFAGETDRLIRRTYEGGPMFGSMQPWIDLIEKLLIKHHLPDLAAKSAKNLRAKYCY
jgi:hypothetical protein